MAALQLRRRTALSPRRRARRRPRSTRSPDQDASLLDIIDHVLTKGVVVSGDVVLALADVDLVYLRLSALLCAADRLTPRKRRM
jgi:gas vesicle protein GvpA/GvpJ/GvpM family